MPLKYFRWGIKALERERLRFLNERTKESRPDVLEHTLQVTSFGGCGTTMLYRFLSRNNAPVPPAVDDWYPWKHMLSPPEDREVKDGFRGIYVFTDPLTATLSVFRRGFQHELVRRMSRDTTNWDTEWGLSDFLDDGQDHFRLTEQYREWTSRDRDYPIMLVKYGALWQNLREITAFAGLPIEAVGDFPERRSRSSDWREESPEVRSGLQRIYGDLHQEIKSAHDITIC